MTDLQGNEMKLPMYCIVGARPVKALSTPDGGMDILAFDWDTGKFERDISYLDRLTFPDNEVEEVSQTVFEQQVEELRKKL